MDVTSTIRFISEYKIRKIQLTQAPANDDFKITIDPSLPISHEEKAALQIDFEKRAPVIAINSYRPSPRGPREQ